MTRPWVQHPAKRAVDLSVGAGLLVLAAPVLALLCALVRLLMGRPLFFRQLRAGRDGREFRLWKLRTMAPERDATGAEVPELDRITRLGAFLRASSLDELPQLVNVVRGEMSLVGPRPLLPEYVERYSPEQARRLLARPGVTGLAQVSGRNALSWEDRFALDVRYVDTATWRTDLAILGRTLRRVLRPEGIATEGHATSPYFLGTDPLRPDGEAGADAAR
jgi:lipopolysaccharide/colanic/teichoic acid biosynthesis glycosyltransferase